MSSPWMLFAESLTISCRLQKEIGMGRYIVSHMFKELVHNHSAAALPL